MSENRVKVAIIGAGGIAESAHIPAFMRNQKTEVAAVVDTNGKQLAKVAKKYKIKNTFSSVDALLESMKIDAMSICTPPDTHAAIALKGLLGGIHVFCEKPMTTDVESAKTMVAASKSAGKLLMVGYHRRFIPSYQKAKQQIQNGSLGHVYCVEDHFVEPNPLYSFTKSTWFFKPNLGGVLLDIAPHVFDMLNFMFNEYPLAVFARATTFLDQPVEDCCVFVLEYPNGKIGVGTTSWLSAKAVETLNVFGTAQNLYVSPGYFMKENSNEFREIGLLRAAGESLVTMKFPNLPFASTRRVDTYQAEIDYFIDRILNNTVSIDNALNGLSVVLSIEAAKMSIEKGCRIEIPHPEKQL
jgi:predicted dehydrogenase